MNNEKKKRKLKETKFTGGSASYQLKCKRPEPLWFVHDRPPFLMYSCEVAWFRLQRRNYELRCVGGKIAAAPGTTVHCARHCCG